MNKTDKILALCEKDLRDEFGLPLTPSEIAKLAGCTSELVRQVVGNVGGHHLISLKSKKRREKEFNQRKLICKPSSFVRFINKWLLEIDQRFCSYCKKVKSINDFSFYNRKNGIIQYTKCKQCNREKVAKWQRENRERHNEWQRNYKRNKAK